MITLSTIRTALKIAAKSARDGQWDGLSTAWSKAQVAEQQLRLMRQLHQTGDPDVTVSNPC